MKFKYSTITRTLEVFGGNMTHIYDNVNESEITDLWPTPSLKMRFGGSDVKSRSS